MLTNSKSMAQYPLKNSSTANFFTGSFDTTNNLQNYDPLLTGYGFIFWVKVPKFMDQIFPSNVFKDFTQKNFKSLGGLSDIDLQTANVTQGFGANELHFAGTIQKGNTEFTLKHQEFSGSPVGTLYKAWTTGIRDPETDIATYPKMFNMDYSAANHTGQLLYVATRPDANNVSKNIVEFACMWTNVMPKRVPIGHFNFDIGSRDQVEIEMPFSGDFHMSAGIDEYAKELLSKAYAFNTMGLYNPKDSTKYNSNETIKNISDSWGQYRTNLQVNATT